jgi:hypothetical protein
MPEIDAALSKALREHPDDIVDLIVHVSGDLGQRVEALQKRGVEIRRRFRLTGALGIRCTGRAALSFARSSWVTKIEADGPVRALGR